MTSKSFRQLSKPTIKSGLSVFLVQTYMYPPKSHFSKSVKFGTKRKLMTSKSHWQPSKRLIKSGLQVFWSKPTGTPKIALFQIGQVLYQTKAKWPRKPSCSYRNLPLKAVCQFFCSNLYTYTCPPKLHVSKSDKFGFNLKQMDTGGF